MPLGLSAPRRLHGTTPLSIEPRWWLAVVVGMSMGCNALPALPRSAPRPPEIKTKTSLDQSVVQTATPVERTLAPERLAFDRLDEESPLPPALDRPAGGLALPKGSANPPTTTPSPLPTPILDEAIVRANAQTESIAEEVGKTEPTKAPASVVIPPKPILDPITSAIETPPTGPSAPTPAPAPAPAPAPIATTPLPAAVEVKRPEEIWRDGVRTLRAVARERMKETNPPGSPNWAVRDRLLGWLAEPDIDPDPRSGEHVAQGRAVLKGLAALIEAGPANATRGAEIREAVAALEARAPLEVAELKLCRKVDGFGNIDPFEPAIRKPGQAVIVYCEVAGLAYEPIGPAFRSRLAAQVEIFAEGSETPVWSQTPDVAEDTCRRRRRDYYVNYRINLPESIGPGTYRLRLTQRDLVADQVATRETPLSIQK